jgi:biopolymer transport protein ExbD
MSKFKKNGRQPAPAFDTASLPDLVFTLLFFFIILSNVSDVIPEVKPNLEEPVATAHSAPDPQALHTRIYIGQYRTEENTAATIQVNDRLITLAELKSCLTQLKSRLSTEEQTRMTVSIHADKDTPMHVIQSIEHVLRDVRMLKLNYAVKTE